MEERKNRRLRHPLSLFLKTEHFKLATLNNFVSEGRQSQDGAWLLGFRVPPAFQAGMFQLTKENDSPRKKARNTKTSIWKNEALHQEDEPQACPRVPQVPALAIFAVSCG
jgi:hypothetical protein